MWPSRKRQSNAQKYRSVGLGGGFSQQIGSHHSHSSIPLSSADQGVHERIKDIAPLQPSQRHQILWHCRRMGTAADRHGTGNQWRAQGLLAISATNCLAKNNDVLGSCCWIGVHSQPRRHPLRHCGQELPLLKRTCEFVLHCFQSFSC